MLILDVKTDIYLPKSHTIINYTKYFIKLNYHTHIYNLHYTFSIEEQVRFI